MWHPVHIHSEFHRVLSRTGGCRPLDERDGMRKRTLFCSETNESVEVFFKFRDIRAVGVPLSQHRDEDMAMMARFDIKP